MLSSLLPAAIWSTCTMGFNSPSPLSKVRPWVLGSFLSLQVLEQVKVKQPGWTGVLAWLLSST